MLAVVLAWAMLAQVLVWTTTWNRWFIFVVSALPFVIWMYKRPQDF